MAARLTAFLVSAIVAVTFVAGLIVGAQREDDGGPADLIIHNAHVYLGASTDAAEALAIRDGKIVRVGSNKEIDRLRRRQTLDAAGGTVVAGLNDAGLSLLDTSPDLTRAQRVDALKKAIANAHRLGLTSVQTMVGSADDLALLTELQAQKALKLRVFVALAATLPLDDAGLEQLETLRKQATSDVKAADMPALLKIGAVRLTLQSAAEARGTQKPRTGTRKAAADQVAHLADAIARLDRNHWQIIIDASTPAEVTMAADAFELAFGPQAAASIRTRRHRVELSTPMDTALTARLNSLELVPSIPMSVVTALAAATPEARTAALAAADSPIPAATLAPADTDTAPRSAAALASAKTAADDDAAAGEGAASGPNAAAGDARAAVASAASDSPASTATALMPAATTAAPIATAASAASAASAAGTSALATLAELLLSNPLTVIRSDAASGALDPLTAIAAAAAATEPVDAIAAIIDAYTSHAAYASHDEAFKGAVVKDQAADLVIFSADLFATTPGADRPLDAFVTATVMNGEVVFTRSATAKPAPTTN